MKYILLRDNVVSEIIPEVNPQLPDFTIEQRYPKSFLDTLLVCDDEANVQLNDVYDQESNTFTKMEEMLSKSVSQDG